MTVYPQVMRSPNLPARPPISGAELMSVTTAQSGAPPCGRAGDPDEPKRGAWTLEMPQRAGTYLVATSGGRTRSLRRVDWDAVTQTFRDTANEPWFEWWWSEPECGWSGALEQSSPW